MNILIFQQSMGVGGVNVVSATLARKFIEEGHQVDVFAFFKGRDDMPKESYESIPVHIGYGFKVNRQNTTLVRNLIKERGIELIINQWGLPYVPTATLKKACKGTDTKWISYYHSNPLFNGRIQEVVIALSGQKSLIKCMLLRLKLAIAKTITGRMMRHNYHECWRFMVLSEAYIENFHKFTGLRHTEKLRVMTNPITVDSSGYSFSQDNKEKEIIFVGRLDPISKKVSRLVAAWSFIEAQCQGWRLTIVGDGPERGTIEDLISKYGLKRVGIEGFKPPRPYYERASVLAMTSDFEGWPLVLGECMTFGVVPVVYDSFEALHDIVDNGVNGIIVPKEDGKFSARIMAESLLLVIDDKEYREKMMRQAIVKSRDFSIEGIYAKWEAVFKELSDGK